MGIWQKISSWWRSDSVAAESEAVRDNSQVERDLAAEDYEGRKDDQHLRGEGIGGGADVFADYERDSETPADPAP